MKDTVHIHGDDNVAVLIEARGGIPGGHKIALRDIKSGEHIIKYGCVIGEAAAPIKAGEHVHVHNMRTLLSEEPQYRYNGNAEGRPVGGSPETDREISLYRRKDGAVGIRNEIWIIPTVGCVNAAAEKLASWADSTFAGKGIDAVFALSHPYGCSQMGDDHRSTQKILADLAKHPNAAAVLVMALGCENNTLDQFKAALGEYACDSDRIAFLTSQDEGDEIAAGKEILTRLASCASKEKRSPGKLSELVIGMKCGGSDGYSGITANALVGKTCDALTAAGGTAILTEVPEMFGAETLLMDRAENREVFDKIVSLINDFKDYYKKHDQVVYENPSPGNKAGGITTLEDKSCGCVQKGGRSTVTDVFRYGERIPSSKRGLVLLEGPGNDIVSTTAMTAAGAHLILFTTGRGTPLGAPVPTVKIASNSALAAAKKTWIDFDAGKMLDTDVDKLSADMIELVCALASGKTKTRNEINAYRQIAVFKNGVTL